MVDENLEIKENIKERGQWNRTLLLNKVIKQFIFQPSGGKKRYNSTYLYKDMMISYNKQYISVWTQIKRLIRAE